MTIKIRKYVATVARYTEHEDGSISKSTEKLVLKGQRFKGSSVERQIPQGAVLMTHGWEETAFDVDPAKLEAWLLENGVKVDSEN